MNFIGADNHVMGDTQCGDSLERRSVNYPPHRIHRVRQHEHVDRMLALKRFPEGIERKRPTGLWSHG